MEEDFNTLHDLLPMSNRKTSIRMDGEVLELVWQNGNVITSSQSSRRTVPSFNEPNRFNALSSDIPLKCGGNLETCNGSIREDETVPWLQYLFDDSLGKDMWFGSSFGMPVNEVPNKPRNDKSTKFGCHKETNGTLDSMTSLLPVQQINGAVASRLANSSQFSNCTRGDAGSTDEYCLGAKGVETASNNDVRQCSSTATKTSSNFCNNQVKSQPVLYNTLLRNVLLENVTKQFGDTTREEVHPSRLTSTRDITTTTTATTSSVASGSSIGRLVQQQSTNDRHKSHKRKARHVEESDYHSEEAEYLSRKERKSPQRSASARRSRSSEVHNLSERRRRDRINEKMKALQELIPHCDKTDKASMLDEAIEYLKSLQLQVQIMWMGNGMAPVMLPNVQHYLSSLSMGMGHCSVSTLPGSLSMPRSMIDPLMSSANVTNQAAVAAAAALAHSALLQNANVPDAYAHYLRFNHIQPPLEVPNFFTPYSSQFQRVPTVGSNQASEGTGPSENTRHMRSEAKCRRIK